MMKTRNWIPILILLGVACEVLATWIYLFYNPFIEFFSNELWAIIFVGLGLLAFYFAKETKREIKLYNLK